MCHDAEKRSPPAGRFAVYSWFCINNVSRFDSSHVSPLFKGTTKRKSTSILQCPLYASLSTATTKRTGLGPTVPTLVFNPEEFVAPTASKKDNRVSMTGWDIGTGCGMDYMMGIIEMYIREGDALVWMVDSTDIGGRKVPNDVVTDLCLTDLRGAIGKDLIFEGICKYITESNGTQTTGRTYHVSMVYFWIQIVHFGIQHTTPSTVHEGQVDNLADEFARFLIVNPYVVVGQLWMGYYAKDMLMSLEARMRMVLPDKKPLPSIPTRDNVNKLLPSS